RLGLPLGGQVHIDPTGEEVLGVPLAFAVPQQHQSPHCHGCHPAGSVDSARHTPPRTTTTWTTERPAPVSPGGEGRRSPPPNVALARRRRRWHRPPPARMPPLSLGTPSLNADPNDPRNTMGRIS